ncbi:related to b mating type locus, bE1 allele [Melanopsichium pennsylvanicum]|uniref:Related to b mating type locus, bE1 allele n=2 Tax=Melanopsichium pennsylvanicum TaxID=63383 RepID=A0AAJ4XGI6_9BASI|nr:b mating type locus, bE1 allele [Melanopsichium pennsylvanicum 4]SNX81907.1 related to b mating type locus, bE1 allele [Melanopsichium pennsylvanicum]
MNFSAGSLLRSLLDIEDEFLNTDQGTAANIIFKLKRLHSDPETVRTGEHSDPVAIEEILRATQRLQLVAKARIELEDAFGSICTTMIQDASTMLGGMRRAEATLEARDLSETLPSYHMRKHFLATIDDPYPSQEDKELLITLTNDSTSRNGSKHLQLHQLTLWFINARRRSGWSQILRKFARNDRNRMRLLVQAKMLSSNLPIRSPSNTSALTHSLDDILRDNLGGKLTAADKESFEEAWTSMLSWIKYGVKEKVGSWVHDLVADNKKGPSKSGNSRAVTTAANRTPERRTATLKTKAKPKKSKQRASKTPSTDSNRGGIQSTPELSLCSTADTSFSSLNGNLSMALYDPFTQCEELLQNPTLNATKGGRKVRALPKRAAQKLTAENLCTNDADTCLPGRNQEAHSKALVSHLAQINTSFSPQRVLPFDALGQVPMPAVPRRESLSSNSLSAAFG